MRSTDGDAALELWHDVAMKKKAKKESAKATLSRVKKEMAKPRVAQSARTEEKRDSYRTLNWPEEKRNVRR